jgi:hypothetical protein
MLCSEILATAEAGVISASALDRAEERSGAGCGDSRRQSRVPEGLNARVHLPLAAPRRMWFPRPDSSLGRPHSGDVPWLPGSRPPHPLEARPITRGKGCYRVLMRRIRGSDSKGAKTGHQPVQAPYRSKHAVGIRFDKAAEECRHRAADEPARRAQTATGCLQPRRGRQVLAPSGTRGCYFIGNQTSIMLQCDPTGLGIFSIFHRYPESPKDLPIIRANS